MTFLDFRDRFQRHVNDLLRARAVFVADVGGDELWNAYLGSFPPGMNEVYRVRRSHDCSCCRHFLRDFGAVVSVVDNEVVTAWDFDAGDYQPVADALAALVRSRPIAGVFVTKQAGFGVEKSRAQREGGDVVTFHHFRVEVPAHLVRRSAESEASIATEHRATHDVFKRSLEEIDSTDTVLDLIAEGSLYRGEEWQAPLAEFARLQAEYRALAAAKRDAFCWAKSVEVGGSVGRIRNHSIGVLLQDITAGMDALEAVRRYEQIVAPQNYKRPKEVFTRRMVEQAEALVRELGLLDSLPRRFARLSDVTINNVLFADRDARPHMAGASTVFDVLKNEATVSAKSFERAPAVGIDELVASPPSRIELLLENRHLPNLVSLIAPENAESPSLFKWDNGFSWAYAGNIADSEMKQRVAMAGGKVDGVLRFSIQWNEHGDNANDFDAHTVEPNENHIYFPNKARRHSSTGMLDVDIIHPHGVAVENIAWADPARMPRGEYRLYVHCFSERGGRSGFAAEVECGGEVREYEYRQFVRDGATVDVARVRFDGSSFEVVDALPPSTAQREAWGLKTNRWQRVSLVLHSPNHWDGEGVGHRHYLFMVPGCVNDTRPNGFFNEYLREDFMEHKRVFAALGSMMRVEPAADQLSGLGFSATRRNSILARVDGRVVKIVF